AHQYFTRAYDIGSTSADSIIEAAWPRDSLVRDAVSVIRAFRPHVIISLFSADSSESDASHRVAAAVAREAFALASDTVRLPPKLTSLLPPWTVSRLVRRVDSSGHQAGLIAIDVGEFDRARARSYAEIGAEIRRLQRTQPQPAPPSLGHVLRYLRLDLSRNEGTADTTFFAAADTSFERFRGVGSFAVRMLLDSLVGSLDALRALAPR